MMTLLFLMIAHGLKINNDALLVAEKMGIPFQTVDLSRKNIRRKIIDYMFLNMKRTTLIRMCCVADKI
jgi:hypothetical protein